MLCCIPEHAWGTRTRMQRQEDMRILVHVILTQTLNLSLTSSDKCLHSPDHAIEVLYI